MTQKSHRGTEGHHRINERGAILAMVVVTALVSAIGSYALLMMATSQARQGVFDIKRVQSLYAAEGGLVWAQQRLLANPTYCGGVVPSPPAPVGITVTVSVQPPSCVAGDTHTLSATVDY